MAFVQYLVFDGIPLPLPDSYEVQLADVFGFSQVAESADGV